MTSFDLSFATLAICACLLPAFYHLARAISKRLFTGIVKIPSPPISTWKKYTIGHNVLSLMMRQSAVKVAGTYTAWFDEYGPTIVVRSLFGSPDVWTISQEAIRRIQITHPYLYHKAMITRASLGSLVGKDGILLAEGDTHRKLRKAVSPAMHNDALRHVGGIFLREGKLLSDRLAALDVKLQGVGNHGTDILTAVRIGTFTVIVEATFGTGRVLPDAMEKLCYAYLETLSEPPRHVMRRYFLQTFFTFLPPHWFGFREDLKRYIRETVAVLCREPEKSGHAENCTPLLSYIVGEEAKKEIPEQLLVDSVLGFLVAGQATSSTTISWTFYLLAKDPHWQDRLFEELHNEWTESDGLEALDRLPLLSRVVRECLRLYPPVAYSLRVASQDDTLDGFRIPKSTSIRIPWHVVHRDEKVWGPDAHVFNPDRFLDPKEVARTRMHWQPFLHGPRNCVGQRFALLEIKAFVSQVLIRLRAHLQPDRDPPAITFGTFSTPRHMKVYFTPRETV